MGHGAPLSTVDVNDQPAMRRAWLALKRVRSLIVYPIGDAIGDAARLGLTPPVLGAEPAYRDFRRCYA